MPAHVLIVDDEPDVRDMMAMLLSVYGFETSEARNGAEALAEMRRRRPTLVLLDIMMPVMDGFQFRRAQREDPELADVPVVAFSAAFEPSVIEAALGLRCFRKSDAYDPLIEEMQAMCGMR